jgi:hypothetical protein
VNHPPQVQPEAHPCADALQHKIVASNQLQAHAQSNRDSKSGTEALSNGNQTSISSFQLCTIRHKDCGSLREPSSTRTVRNKSSTTLRSGHRFRDTMQTTHQCKAVRPTESTAFTFAPLASKCFTVSTCPFPAAQNNGVLRTQSPTKLNPNTKHDRNIQGSPPPHKGDNLPTTHWYLPHQCQGLHHTAFAWLAAHWCVRIVQQSDSRSNPCHHPRSDYNRDSLNP